MFDAVTVCDMCGTQAEVEHFNGNSTMRLPPLWVTISPMVGIRGGDADYRDLIRDRLKKMIPIYHICPNCSIDDEVRAKLEEIRLEEELKEKAKRDEEEKKVRAELEAAEAKMKQITETPRRQLSLGH